MRDVTDTIRLTLPFCIIYFHYNILYWVSNILHSTRSKTLYTALLINKFHTPKPTIINNQSSQTNPTKE